MTNDERIEINNKCAELYGIAPFTYKNSFWVSFETRTHLIDDWSRLMPLAVEQGVFFNIDGEQIDTWYYEGSTYSEEVITMYYGHPSKAHAVQAALVKALIAKKESE